MAGYRSGNASRKYQSPAGKKEKPDVKLNPSKPAVSVTKIVLDSPDLPKFKKIPKVALPVKNLKTDSQLTFQDSVWVWLPDVSANPAPPHVWQMRLSGRAGTKTIFRDYRLILDSTNEAKTSQSGKTASRTFQSAQWQLSGGGAVSNNFAKASQPELSTKSPLGGAPVKDSEVNPFWQNLAILGSALIGLYGLLWAASRFLRFSVRVIAPDAKNVTPGLPRREQAMAASTTESENSGRTQESLFRNQDGQSFPFEINSPGPLPNLPPASMPVPDTRISAAGSYFFTELLLTAGPRKKYMSDPEADKDLGEDVCGLVTNQQQLLLWVLDGTSDQYCLRHPIDKKEYFSSRLLAQSIANKLRMAFTQLSTTSLEQVLNQAITAVKTDWLRHLQDLPPEEQTVLQANILNKNIPECATTLLFGTLSLAGNLTAYRSGDCKMVLYTQPHQNQAALLETPLLAKNEASNDRLFFRLIINPAGEFDILHNTPKFEIIQHSQVHALAAFSDGIGLETETRLRELADKSLESMREDIIYQLQGTADDKAICFVEIRQAPHPQPLPSGEGSYL
ncbi:protein phosphatase 2C domain-containing protein [Adhaeribacter pallidiroseus]|uniref:PPM-type phosphatase domain-containing protein n=1 Tax=Adhaeribacter pallidiroseus TaxID=2072847 RepID=A0A369QK99_9BACT|nr:protein phosphatase 2C domain-containing protein [Adhaeribacter pallidiroseus]RDC62688.1 hypothetical protein AHMF7616_01282 [Adhaeribacter pallidiroseus]